MLTHSFLMHGAGKMCNVNRSEVFKANEIGVYHAMNKTTRGIYLFGIDLTSENDYRDRRGWYRDRMALLARFFCIDVLAYSIMSNHWHAILRNRPDLATKLTPREVAIRWLSVTSRAKCRNKNGGKITEAEIAKIVNDPEAVEERRARLSNISWFVRQMCQTLSRRCNKEDQVTGHLFGNRFQMNRLPTEEEILAGMLYVDLNPLRAGLADALDDFAEVSISERLTTLEGEAADLESWLAPLELETEVDGKQVVVANKLTAEQIEERVRKREALSDSLGCVPMKLEAYQELLWHLALQARPELQATDRLPANIFRSPLKLAGENINIDELAERHAQMGRRYASPVDLQTRIAIAQRQAGGGSVPIDNTWASV
ncbi:hypothetical protein FF011L_47040 [Roseimaritima multifibrata]|uniref:Transposase IS200-like domain-containing protein n=1 Tax=Roseimaritima multifibrata TaxID=1930274 RepID=A0A517MLZ6_9BACT|nr:hypothetical protein [Roseimaritima multifibrata]QDS95903.1 hypothetical protein FF011L_47040 [Roseimaritima multifibrata]